MNEKFFQLPEEKQQRIINAGFRIFSLNTYKKSPMSEIAAEAGISKSLLFHYFKNKQELYLFLWNHAAEITIAAMKEYACYESDDFFEMMELGLQAKIHIMKKNPYLGTFTMKAFYEKEPAIREEIQKSYMYLVNASAEVSLEKINPQDFIPGIDLQEMYQHMFWVTEGYLWEELKKEQFDVNKMEQDFKRMMAFWKKVYCRKGGSVDECNGN